MYDFQHTGLVPQGNLFVGNISSVPHFLLWSSKRVSGCALGMSNLSQFDNPVLK